MYSVPTSEVFYSSGKTFVIYYSIDESKYLIHACLEGPEAGVYYREEGKITNGKSVKINLLTTDFTINI